jgi:hypothetical protein
MFGDGFPAPVSAGPANVPRGDSDFNAQARKGYQKGYRQNNGYHKYLLQKFVIFLIPRGV